MKTDLQNHPSHYLILILLLIIGLLFFILAGFDPLLQRLVIAGTALTYTLWGLVHHHYTDKVTSGIVLEYALVGLLGFVIINGLLTGR